MSTILAGSYGWLNRDGTLHAQPVFSSSVPFEGRPECFVPLIIDAQPAYDNTTQALVPGVAFLAGGTVHIPWTIVALPQDQQNTIADKTALQSQAQAAYTALKAHTATAAQTQTILALVLRYVAAQDGITLT